ncbi:protein phosphatase 2C domain-containing protein [Argonema antarcticum]|uniref:protein phosphatase 2C domain-containing protein n=1 Tax=Argonema antarcticum TaxID=2942763 RepID=UPI00201270CC|nr:protein phosphatase 2C domain-containing protein [Argonema antarcticum]MCL1470218.1 protein phosphatase 2C domain-containing protein [Argonema antarcticum A004/B2]
MQEQFELAAGSVKGTEHQRLGKNNQDGYYSINLQGKNLIAVVCDGCGSGQHSEVGAKIGARLLVETIRRSLPYREGFWQDIHAKVLMQLRNFAQGFGDNLADIVNDYFLFTVVGILIIPEGAFIFAIGDGVFAINREVVQLGPYANNAPPYLGYGILDEVNQNWQFQVHRTLPISEVKSILIGTDGVSGLIKSESLNLPGKSEMVGEISQFWREDRYFMNSDNIRRRLSLINREVTYPNWEERSLLKQGGLLPDDTTLLVIRRKKLLSNP